MVNFSKKEQSVLNVASQPPTSLRKHPVGNGDIAVEAGVREQKSPKRVGAPFRLKRKFPQEVALIPLIRCFKNAGDQAPQGIGPETFLNYL